jgi:hypothetical protein
MTEGTKRPKPRRGGLFVGCDASRPFSFCFSAARRWKPSRAQSTFDHWQSGEGSIGDCRAAEKQKEDSGGSPGYKQATPTGFRSRSLNGATQRGEDAENLKDVAPLFLKSSFGELNKGRAPSHVGSYLLCVIASLRLCVEFRVNSHGLGRCSALTLERPNS